VTRFVRHVVGEQEEVEPPRLRAKWDTLATELMAADARCSALSSATGRLTDEVAAVEDEASEVQEHLRPPQTWLGATSRPLGRHVHRSGA